MAGAAETQRDQREQSKGHGTPPGQFRHFTSSHPAGADYSTAGFEVSECTQAGPSSFSLSGMLNRGVLLILGALWGCQRGVPSTAGVENKPPVWPPGQSIGNSQLCECNVCELKRCCADTEVQDEGNRDTPEPVSGGDALGLSVSSCASRCTRATWRIELGRVCTDSPPVECCRSQRM